MVSDLEIWLAANLLIREHGDDAEIVRRAIMGMQAAPTGKPN